MSCEATRGDPMYGSATMALMSRAAKAGGAGAIHANGPEDVAAIRAVTGLPIVGIHKVGHALDVFITPTVETAAEVVRADADLVAVDGTRRGRPGGQPLAEQVARIHYDLGVPMIIDFDTVEAGLAAREAGADYVATTLSGYVGGPAMAEPDIELVAVLAANSTVQ
jgi:N-acylglucosamine-6-phosphate 2-epimerase